MEGDIKVTINYDKLEVDSKWDGLKGYLSDTKLLQKSGIRKNVVIELIYRGFI